jgi:hypothetical protein
MLSLKPVFFYHLLSIALRAMGVPDVYPFIVTKDMIKK